MSTESKHTPGPWGMETVRTSCGVCHKVGPWPHKWRVGDSMSACIYDDYPSPPEGTDTMLANARLIAAAPELFEALDLARKYMKLCLGSSFWDGPNPYPIIDAALAKARGEVDA